MRLLLAEDDLMLGESLRDALRAAGYVTDWVKDGEHALAALKDEPFDLAIIDVGLP
ncbi:MAG: DNA-binding response regulator, partial [Thalassolituus sp.]